MHIEDTFKSIYYPVRNSRGEERSQDGLSDAVMHAHRSKPDRRNFWKYEVHAGGRQIGWIKDKRDLRQYVGRNVNIVTMSGTAHVTVR